MKYEIDIYETNKSNTARFLLGKSGSNPLIVVGINPSTADSKKPDPTMRKVMAIAELMGKDGFIMLNVYPKTSTNPTELPAEVDEQLFQTYLDIIYDKFLELGLDRKWVHVLMAFGDSIGKRKYLKRCLHRVVETLESSIGSIEYIRMGCYTDRGNPRHPLYLPTDTPVKLMNIKKYLENADL